MPESKAQRQVIAGLYGAEPQRCYRAREACIAAENPCVTGILLLGQPQQLAVAARDQVSSLHTLLAESVRSFRVQDLDYRRIAGVNPLCVQQAQITLETAVDRLVLLPTSWNHEHFCCKENSATG